MAGYGIPVENLTTYMQELVMIFHIYNKVQKSIYIYPAILASPTEYTYLYLYILDIPPLSYI